MPELHPDPSMSPGSSHCWVRKGTKRLMKGCAVVEGSWRVQRLMGWCRLKEDAIVEGAKVGECKG